MVVLTRKQEIKILEFLADAEWIGSGAARTVFKVRGELRAYLESILPDIAYVPCIVKVCIGSDGWHQNRNEIAFYEEYENLNVLAKIFAHGVFVEIMEEVKSIAHITRRYYSDIIEGTDTLEEEGFSEEECNAIMNVINTLTDICGESSDNGQIGYGSLNDFVAFDYGYIINSDESLCSDYDSVGECDDSRVEYLEGLVEILQAADFIEQWDLLDAAENWLKDYYGECDDYDDYEEEEESSTSSYSDYDDTSYWESESSPSSEDMKDTSFWEKD